MNRWRKHVRNSDPLSSELGAKSVTYRMDGQKFKLLMAYYECAHPLNAAQAVKLTNIDIDHGACYWKRVGDLHRDGMIDLTGRLTVSPISDELMQEYVINRVGVKQIESMIQ
jgi:hypothetical protein